MPVVSLPAVSQPSVPAGPSLSVPSGAVPALVDAPTPARMPSVGELPIAPPQSDTMGIAVPRPAEQPDIATAPVAATVPVPVVLPRTGGPVAATAGSPWASLAAILAILSGLAMWWRSFIVRR